MEVVRTISLINNNKVVDVSHSDGFEENVEGRSTIGAFLSHSFNVISFILLKIKR